MRSPFALFTLVALTCTNAVVGSVFLPNSRTFSPVTHGVTYKRDLPSSTRGSDIRRVPVAGYMKGTAMAIPGYGMAEQVFVGGFSNFLSIYNLIITGRILLSWIPQAQGVGFLQPVYQITDPYLNLFRGIIPPVFGLDLSPILAFFFLSFLGNVTMAVGADIPEEIRRKYENSRFGELSARGAKLLMQQSRAGGVTVQNPPSFAM